MDSDCHDSDHTVANNGCQPEAREKRRKTAGCGGAAPDVAALPCLFVTTASDPKEEDSSPLPGPRRKQAEALTENIKWTAAVFGREFIGFLTLTLGDKDAGGRYRNLRDRKEAQRRFHSLLTNVISKRYVCGVIVTERHSNGGIHFHLAVVCANDIRGEIDFEACFPRKDGYGKPAHRPDYSTANDAIKREWAFWRMVTKRFGFGRHQLQPMRENGEALGRYLGEYLSKDWANRWPEDKGARCVRYFGHWDRTPHKKGEVRKKPPYNSRFGWIHPRSRAWREMLRQTVIILNCKGAGITEENIKDILGSKWAWKMARLFESVRFEVLDRHDKELRDAIEEHNFKVQTRWLAARGNPERSCWWTVLELELDHLRVSPRWRQQMQELELAKECEAAIQMGEQKLARQILKREQKQRLLKEVAVEFKNWGGWK